MKNKPFADICGKEIRLQGRLIRIASIDGDKFTFPDNPEVFLEHLRESGVRIDLFTFLQRLPESAPKYDYPLEWDNLAVVAVSTFDHWYKSQIRSNVRNRMRQAEKKGVTFKQVPFDDSLITGICEIYNESPIRQGRRFPHYGMTLDKVREYAGTFLDRSIFIGAFLGDSMIGFIKIVMDETRTQACIIHILSMLKHRDKCPTNGLIAYAVRFCAEQRIPYLVYENFSYGKKRGDTLSHFKEINGFQRIELPRYYIPLTPIGKAALRLGLHRRLIDYFPEPIMAKLRELRAAWYSRELRVPDET